MTDIHTEDATSSYDSLGTYVTKPYSFHGIAYDTRTNFTENPNEFTSTGSYTFELTTEFSGPQEIDTITIHASSGTGEWSIDGDILTQIFAGDTSELVLLEFTNSKMRLRLDQDLTNDINGLIVRDIATIFSTFERN